MRDERKLYIIIPCYNEQEVLPVTAPLFLQELHLLEEKGLVSRDSRILFVDDGSKDCTWEIICSLSGQDPHYMGIRQSRNRGHQNAVWAGLMEAKAHADMTISIDCDGQDDISAMEQMVQEYHNGCDVVYGVRNNRDSDSFFKRGSAQLFYRIMNKLGTEVVYNHADYRLISSRALAALADFREVNLFLRGMVPLVGFKSTSVFYERHERISGKSHYPLRKMLALAADGITSMSIKPIHIITVFGAIISCFSFVGVIWAIIVQLMGNSVAGWASIICIVCFMGGIQLICLGIIGEYMGKIYLEVKDRPRYIISERTEDMKKEAGGQ